MEASLSSQKSNCVCRFCGSDLSPPKEADTLMVTRASPFSNTYLKGHERVCRVKSELERDYWKVVRDWPRPAAAERLKRDGLEVVLARRKG